MSRTTTSWCFTTTESAACISAVQNGPGVAAAKQQGRQEDASDVSRLSYVAMTRAQSQVVAWWAPARDEPNGGLSRLLRGRRPGEPQVPERCDPPKISDDDAMARFQEWEAAGGPVIEESVVAEAPPVPAKPEPSDLEMRHFHRCIDTGWRRTSYSGLVRVAEAVGVTSEPEVTELDDETGDIPLTENASGPVGGIADGGAAAGRDVRVVGARGAGESRPVLPRTLLWSSKLTRGAS